MKISSKFSLALLAGTILSTPANYAAAATLTPTLDTIKAEAADLSGSYELMELTGDLQEGAVEVEIAGVKYYFTPTGDDAALLKTLAGTVAGNLKEDENGIFEFDGKKYSFDVAAIPASAFEYTEGTADDYNFIMQEADAEGNLTAKYYKIVLKPENLTTSESITWGMAEQTGDSSGSVAVNLPNNQTQTFYYAYNKPADYTETGTRIDNTLGTANVTGVVFKDIFSSSSGGAIYNAQDHGDINITADFIGNYADGYSVRGGAIYNSGTIGDITGDFIGNYIDSYNSNGGAIYNSANATIGNITGDFIGNDINISGSGNGGAIYNSANAVIGNITGNFIGNSTSSGHGGAIYNSGIIGNIIGNFVDNSIDFNYNGVYGGAIYNSGTIGNITGDFIGNHAKRINANTYGGAIYNSGTIGDITGDFIGNDGEAIFNYGTIDDITGDFIGNNSIAIHNANNNINFGTIGDITGNFIGNIGGAISNGGTIGDITGDFIGNNGGAIYNSADNSTISSITGDFIGNYASGYGADGGAIYNRWGTIGDITGDFIRNYAESTNDDALGGAIDNFATIGDITGDFIGNYAESTDDNALGGAIYNRGDAISDITGDFIGNYAESTNGNARGGAIYNGGGYISNSGHYSTIGNITGDFIGNHVSGSGGVIYNAGIIGDIAGNFINNYVTSDSGVVAGSVIVNGGGNLIGDSTGSEYSSYYGRPLYTSVGSVTGDFIGNYIKSTGGSAVGGAIYNVTDNDYVSAINKVSGNFTGNHIEVVDGYAYGGAVYNEAQVSVSGLTNPLFHLNVKYGDEEMELYLPLGDPEDGSMQLINGTLTVDSEEEFLAYKQYTVYTQLLKLDPANITAADYVELMIQLGTIPEDQRDEALAKFEALSPEEQEEELSEIRQMAELMHNMVDTATPVTEITTTVDIKGALNFYNSSFRNNYVKSENGEAKGGAIYGNGITITADNYTSIIDGNKANDENNAFYVLNKTRLGSLEQIFPVGDLTLDITSSTANLTLTTLNNGVILLNDGIDGESGYGIAITGDKGVDTAGSTGGLSLFNNDGDGRTSQYIKLNNSIANAGNIDIVNTTLSFGEGPYGKGEIVSDGDPVTKVSLQNAAFDLYNKYQDTVNLAGWNANNGYLHVDVDVAAGTADVLNIAGDVVGQTKVIVYAGSTADIRGESILFATATGTGSADSFSVYRVYNSPYMFDVAYNPAGTAGKEWSLTMNDKENEYAGILPAPLGTPSVPDVEDPEVPDIEDSEIPDIDLPTAPSKVYAEVVAYGALPAAALEQTRNMVDNIGNQIKNSRVYTRSCSFVDGYWNGEPYYNLWVNPTYYTSNIDSPFAIDADIWGIEAGGDIQHDIHNRLGIFVSYRQGEYDMSGNGDKYRSPVGSEIDIDSYLAGLYYRYDKNNWYAFATLYGGIQEADIKTDDGMKSDTDGVEFGASIEAGYDYALTDSVTLTPELGVFYTQVNYDDATDSMGKSASYDNARQIELEAGVKLAKTFMTDESFANVYVKPSVVQTIVDGEDVNITGLGDVEALDDATLGRIEIGGRYGFTTNLSAYGWANYTFGSDYDATTFGLGLNYAF